MMRRGTEEVIDLSLRDGEKANHEEREKEER